MSEEEDNEIVTTIGSRYDGEGYTVSWMEYKYYTMQLRKASFLATQLYDVGVSSVSIMVCIGRLIGKRMMITQRRTASI